MTIKELIEELNDFIAAGYSAETEVLVHSGSGWTDPYDKPIMRPITLKYYKAYKTFLQYTGQRRNLRKNDKVKDAIIIF